MSIKTLILLIQDRSDAGIAKFVNNMTFAQLMSVLQANETLMDEAIRLPIGALMGRDVATLEMAIRGAIENRLIWDCK